MVFGNDYMYVQLMIMTITLFHLHAASAYGNEFFIGFMRSVGGNIRATNLRLVIGTTKPNKSEVEFVVESNGQLIHKGNVVKPSPVKISIPQELQIINNDHENRQKGIHVYTVSQNDTVYVLAENFIHTLTYGVFLAYPCGFEVTEENNPKPYEYIVTSTEVLSFFHSEFLLVGCYNDTLFDIIPAQPVDLPEDLQAKNGSYADLISVNASGNYSATIHRMQTLLVLSAHDLSGTRILSNKPLTVISGHECARVPISTSGCEPFAVYIPPTNAWGKRFLLVPFAGRNGPQTFKAISSVDNTTFSYTCNATSHTSTQKRILELNTSQPCYLESSSPTLIVQFSTGQDIDRRGDPAIALISPVENYVHETELLTLPFEANYISITASVNYFDCSSMFLDGLPLNCTWDEIYDRHGSTVGYACSLFLNGSDNHVQHILHSGDSDGLFSSLAYGFKFSGAIHEGYAYLTGMNFHQTPMPNAITMATGQGEDVQSTVSTTGTNVQSSFPLEYIIIPSGTAALLIGVLTIASIIIGCCCCKKRKP